MDETQQDTSQDLGSHSTPIEIYSAVLYATLGLLERYARLIRPALSEADMPESQRIDMEFRVRMAQKLVVQFHSAEAWNDMVKPIIAGLEKRTPQDVIAQLKDQSSGDFSESVLEDVADVVADRENTQRLIRMLRLPEAPADNA